jgi:hypothetical protein
MSSKAVLKSSVLGYIYRATRIVGVILTAAGAWQLADIGYHAVFNAEADAIVTRLEVRCILQGEGPVAEALTREYECTEAEKTKGLYPNVPFTVGEVTYALLQFHAQDGTTQDVRGRLDVLESNGAEIGAVIPILYDPADPLDIRPANAVRAFLKALSMFTAGAALLFAVLTIRWIASHRRGIELDVAVLQNAHDQTSGRIARKPIPRSKKAAVKFLAPAPPQQPNPRQP